MNSHPRKFAIVGNNYQAKKTVHLIQLLSVLKKHDAIITMNDEYYQFLMNEMRLDLPPIETFKSNQFDADMMLSVGGDGTFLKAASMVGDRGIPILGINTGRLGFLADISPEDIEASFNDIFNNRYQVEDRSVIKVTSEGEPLEGYPCGLNEVSILKTDTSSMISIHTSINGKYLTTYQADGLVIATPTGSTAYSLSVGGPIIVPHSNTVVLTPVAPHSLNMRPIVINDDWEITLDIESRLHHFLISIDGRSEICNEGTRLTIRKAPYKTKVVKRFDQVFFQTLRDKMMWGADSRDTKELTD